MRTLLYFYAMLLRYNLYKVKKQNIKTAPREFFLCVSFYNHYQDLDTERLQNSLSFPYVPSH